jgi:NADH:ubiquinone oxidoreductase subunit F (NADH-binding)
VALDLISPIAQAGVDHHLLGHPRDLAGHLEVHGPLAVALDGAPTWQHALVSSLERSGLRGRGGGGFPASVKLALVSSAGRGGAVVVNAMEGEPASDKDKVLLINTPHLVLDGAQFLAVMCGADQVVVAIPLGRETVAASVIHAIEERQAHGYVRVAETIVRPPDRFISGEESALVNYIESGRSLPVFRPDKGQPLRIGKRSALVHNTETLAHVALIARRGPAAFLARGTDRDPGTCLVTISGAVGLCGVVEVDRGTPMWDIIRLGHPTGTTQALLVGGYGGSWVGPEQFMTPYEATSLQEIGASAGAGVIVALESTSCGLAETARIARYLAEQGAGQCGPCVYGLPAIADDLALLARGSADAALVGRLRRRLDEVEGRGACRHPDGAVAMVRSALDVFAADVALHRTGTPCPHHRNTTSLRFRRPIAL